MSENTDSPALASSEGKKLAVLVLDRPPLPAKEWYWKKIAGVPFLLRNILNIQRSGVNRLILYLNQNQGIDEAFCGRVASDPRVKLPLQWVNRPEHLVKAVGSGSHVFILGGATLHDKTEIASLLTPGLNDREQGRGSHFSIDEQTLNTVLGKLDGFGPTWFKEIFEDPLFPFEKFSGERMLAYLPDADHRTILHQVDFALQHDKLLQSGGGLGNDSFLTRIFSRSVSKRMTRFFIHTPLSPNQVTFLSFALGLVSAWCFYHLDYWMGVTGGGLLLLAIWVDGVDGEMARLTFRESKLGGQLDIYCDNIVHIILFFSIGMGLYAATGESHYPYLGGLAAGGSLVSFMLMATSVVQSKDTESSNPKPEEKTLADKLANRDFTYFLLLTAVVGKVGLFLWFTAVGANLFAIYLIYNEWVASKG